jgi:hypothetical protein
MKQTFQGIPVNFPPPTIAVAAGEGAISAADTYWFWIQGRNRQGFNELSSSAIAVVEANGKINITIPATCRPALDGSNIQEILVLASTTNDPTTATNLASVLGDALPVVVALSADDHLVMGLGQSVAEESELPGDRIRGMRRQLDDWDEIREWSGSAWVRCEPQEFSTYIDSIDGEYGARQSISLVQASMAEPVAYGVDGSDSETVTYWLINDATATVPSSTGIALTVESGGKDISGLINNGSLQIAFAGYANTTSAAKDSLNADESGNMPGIDEWLDYSGPFTGLILPKDLPPGAAYAISLKLNMSDAIARFAAYDGQTIGFRVSLEPYTASLVPMGLFLGDLIASDLGRRRLVPGGMGLTLLGLPGTGLLKISGSQAYLFRERPAQTVSGLGSNSAAQQIYISAQGNLFIASVVGATSALRAVVGTLNGYGQAISAGSQTLNSALRLTVSVPIPTAIRADYPDAIAGSADGVFNASQIRVYAKPLAGNIVYWDSPIPLDVETVNLTFSVAGADLGADSIAAVADTFGLYEPTGASSGGIAGASSFASGAYDIFVAFYYSGTVTEISHSTTLGCIPEADGGLAGLYALLYYSAVPVRQFGHLREFPFNERRPLRQVFCAVSGNNFRWTPEETSSQDLDYAFRVAAGAPASGELALNNADPSLVTQIRFNSLDRDGLTGTEVVSQILTNTYIRLDTAAGAEIWATYQALSPPSLATGIYTLAVAYVAGSGVFVNAALTVISTGSSFVRPYDLKRSQSGRWTVDDSTQTHGVSGVPLAGLGENGDWAFSIDPLTVQYGDLYQKVAGAWVGPLTSILSYTLVAAGYTQPAIAETVTVTVRSNQAYAVDGVVFVEGSGHFRVGSKIGGGQLVLESLAGAIASPGSSISTGAKVLPSGMTGGVGPPGPAVNPRGVYNGATAYVIADSVSYSGSSYVAIAPGTGNLPTNATYWQLLAGQGASGIDGIDGFGIDYGYEAGTSAGASSGRVRLNNAAIASVTEIHASETDFNSVDVSAILGAITAGSLIGFRSKDTANEYAFFQVSSNIVDNGSDRTIPVTYLAHTGTFADPENVLLFASVAGPTGGIGGAGPPGAGINPVGAYNGATVYAIADSVSYEGGSYVATAPGTGNLPTNTAFWQLISAQGNAGAVTAASALTLTEQVGIPSTGADEIDLVNVGNDLQWREESDGATRRAAWRSLVENPQTGTAYTLALTDEFDLVSMNNAAANVLTIPTNATVAFFIGTQILVGRKGLGATQIKGGVGVTVNGVSAGGANIADQWGMATLMKIGTNTWWVVGGLSGAFS